MRILLQHSETKRYLGRAGNWTDNPDSALAFLDEVRAHDYSIYRRLAQAQVVLHNETRALENGGGAESPGAGAETHFYSQSLMIAKENTSQTPKPVRIRVNRTRLTSEPLMAHQMAETVGEPSEPSNREHSRRRSTRPEANGLLTLVKVNIDVGFGNAVFIRGQGKGLTWDKGSRLECVDGTTWIWSTRNEKDRLVFKLLLNDQVWAKGEDIVVEAGKRIEINPAF
jgi:hypothetical protein